MSFDTEACGARIRELLGNRHSSTLIIAPITSRVEKNTGQPMHVNIGRIGYNHVLSVVQLEQIRTIDKQRVIRYLIWEGTHL